MKKIKEYGCYIIIILVAIFDLIYGFIKIHDEYVFLNKAAKTNATITTVINNKKSLTLHVDYYIDDKKYQGTILTTNKKYLDSSTITIYYDKKIPEKISNGEINKSIFIIIIMGFLFLFIDLILFFKKYIKSKQAL